MVRPFLLVGQGDARGCVEEAVNESAHGKDESEIEKVCGNVGFTKAICLHQDVMAQCWKWRVRC